MGEYQANGHDLLISAVIAFLSFVMSNYGIVFRGREEPVLWGMALSGIPRWVFQLAGLGILYEYRMSVSYQKAQHELGMIRNMLENMCGQYEQARVNEEIIHQKYHDLKNTIAILRSGIGEDAQLRWLDNLEQEIRRIEPERLTGNPVLDTILGEKGELCKLGQIQFSYVLDGNLFNGMELDDLCVVFGGALDNAIESVRKLQDPEKRLIHLKAYVQQGYLVICVENICEEKLVYRDGLPVTTKQDDFSHGYGLKGIRHVVEKYGGTMTIQNEDGWFRLMLLIPETVQHEPPKTAGMS